LPRRQRRRRRLSGTYAGPPRTKLPFPINIILNQKFFYIFFIVLMIASMAAVGLGNFTGQNGEGPDIVPGDVTPGPTDVPVLRFPNGPAPVIDATKPHVATLKTNKGDIKIELAEDAPAAVNSFAFLAGSGFYDDTAFFYVDPAYFAQAGDPNCNKEGKTLCSGTAGPEYTLPVEGGLPHERWSVVAPRLPGGDEVHGSQFRILFAPDSRLDGTETVFGRIVDPASQELLSSLQGFALCSVVDTETCSTAQDFAQTLVIEGVTVEAA
jgi:cyclophilin family peptidyl-prolyl cis-trans isomerase